MAVAAKINAVNWFEIPVKDMERARKFYEKVLAVELSLNETGPWTMAWFPMIQDAPGAAGSLREGVVETMDRLAELLANVDRGKKAA